MGSVPGGGTKIPHVEDQKKKKKKSRHSNKSISPHPCNSPSFFPLCNYIRGSQSFFSYPRTPGTHDTVPPISGLAHGGAVVKNLPANAGGARDAGWTPGLGRFPGGGKGSPFQSSCFGNPMDRGALWVTVHGVTKELDMT